MKHELERALLESASRAQTQGNETWELDVLRALSLVRQSELDFPTLEIPIGSNRFKVTTSDKPRGGGVLLFDDIEVLLTAREAGVMQRLITTPNMLVTRDELMSERPTSERNFRNIVGGLQSKLGEDTIIMVSKGRVIFLPAHLLRPISQ